MSLTTSHDLKNGQSTNDFSITRILPKDRDANLRLARRQRASAITEALHQNFNASNCTARKGRKEIYLPLTAITSISTSAHGAANAATCIALLAGLFG